MTQQAKWVNREVDLSPGAGYTLTNAQFITDASTSAGTWDMLFGDLTLMHSDGSIIQLFDRGTSFGFGSYFANGGGVSGQSSTVETVTTSTVEPTPAIAAMPEITTTYYVSDQIGSARSEVSFGSWPLWWGSFDPFGVETDSNSTPNNFKFTGQERDIESGNNYFKARSYASTVGRFMSPDPGWQKASNPLEPLSLNQYTCVLRLARMEDLSALRALIELSVRELQKNDYTAAQMDGALGHTLGVDTQLITDGTYFVVTDSAEKIVGCGGWSFRKTLFGSDHGPGREPARLDPATDAAKVRAIFVHPRFARHGIGSRILAHAEAVARAAGFRAAEMGSTLTGVPVYARRGYARVRDVYVPLPNGEVLPIVYMRKLLL